MNLLLNTLIFLTIFGADRITKWWALTTLSTTPWNVCYGFNLLISWNRGVSWSMFATDGALGFWLLTAIIMAMVLGCAIYTLYRILNHLPALAEIVVLAGALSNVIDRLWFGAVLDFIELYVGTWHWPVFNIADSMILLGVAGIFYRMWRNNE